jgi:broad specificity phosphatase PhoE
MENTLLIITVGLKIGGIMKIYITRHGETEWNKEGRMQGWKNSDLTEKGIENAKRLGESLKHINFDCIYSSPSGRTIETVNCIKGNKDTPIIINDSLREMGFGLWEGMEHSKIKEFYPVQQFNFWNKPHLYESIDGESYEELLSRARQVLNEIVNNTPYENVLVVTHAALIKAIYAILKNYSLEEFWNPPFMNDTCLTVLQVENKEISIILEADISHLD